KGFANSFARVSYRKVDQARLKIRGGFAPGARPARREGMNGLVVTSLLLGIGGAAISAEQCTLKRVPVPPLSQQAVSRMQFDALHAAVTPEGAGERWAEIPWQTDLLAARRQAAQAGKPLF